MGKVEIKTLIDAQVHSLYCGVTMSGKTTLARYHARLLQNAEHDVVVYDPVMTGTAGGGWSVEKKELRTFHTEEAFLKWIEKASGEPERPIFVFVDEAADIFGHGNGENELLPRRVRHQNIYLRLVSQRPKMLPPNVRTQCAHIYMFRLSDDDQKTVLADAGHSKDVVEKQLDTGDFLLLRSGSQVIVSHNVFDLID